MNDVSMPEDIQNNWEYPLARSNSGVRFGKNILAKTLAVSALLPLVFSVGLFLYFIRPSAALIVLHYNVYFGVDLLGVWWQAYALPVFGTLFLLGHLFLARHFYQRSERIAAYLLLLSAGMISGGLFVASIGVVLINY